MEVKVIGDFIYLCISNFDEKGVKQTKMHKLSPNQARKLEDELREARKEINSKIFGNTNSFNPSCA